MRLDEQRRPVPAALLGVLAMFVIPFLPDWLFEGRGRSSTGRVAMCAAT